MSEYPKPSTTREHSRFVANVLVDAAEGYPEAGLGSYVRLLHDVPIFRQATDGGESIEVNLDAFIAGAILACLALGPAVDHPDRDRLLAEARSYLRSLSPDDFAPPGDHSVS